MTLQVSVRWLAPLFLVPTALACSGESPSLATQTGPGAGSSAVSAAATAGAGSPAGGAQAGSTAGAAGSPLIAGGAAGASSGGAANAGGAAAGLGGGSTGGATAGGGGLANGGQPTALPGKILCIGDSITEQEASWIFPLQDGLRSKSCRYQLIGLDAGPYNGEYKVRAGFDGKRVAAGGFSTTGIMNLIAERGIGGVPDVVVEYLGVNNVYGGYIDGKYNPDNRSDPAGSYIRDNKQLFALVRAQNPAAAFLLMKIENLAMPQIDAAIDELVATESTAQSPVIAVENARDVETVDGIHPTAAGSVTLADPVSAALAALLQAQGRCSP